MPLRLTLLVVFSPLIAGAVIVCAVVLALQLACGPIFDAVSRCTQWTPSYD
jgi:hypothetical protein